MYPLHIVLPVEFLFGVQTVCILSVSTASHISLDTGQPSFDLLFFGRKHGCFFPFYSKLLIMSDLCA